MATLSIGGLYLCRKMIGHKVEEGQQHRNMVSIYCENKENSKASSESDAKSKKEKMGKLKIHQVFLVGVEKIGKGLKDNLSPKQKGDWKDLTLVCLSFALYVYISQKIVCTYCAYISFLKHSF